MPHLNGCSAKCGQSPHWSPRTCGLGIFLPRPSPPSSAHIPHVAPTCLLSHVSELLSKGTRHLVASFSTPPSRPHRYLIAFLVPQLDYVAPQASASPSPRALPETSSFRYLWDEWGYRTTLAVTYAALVFSPVSGQHGHPQRRDKVSNILCASYLALGTLQCRRVVPAHPPTHSLGGPSWASPA